MAKPSYIILLLLISIIKIASKLLTPEYNYGKVQDPKKINII